MVNVPQAWLKKNLTAYYQTRQTENPGLKGNPENTAQEYIDHWLSHHLLTSEGGQVNMAVNYKEGKLLINGEKPVLDNFIFNDSVPQTAMSQVRAPLRKRPKAASRWQRWAALPLALAGILLLAQLWLSHHHTPPAAETVTNVQMTTAAPLQFDFYTKLPKMAVDSPAQPPADASAHLKNSPAATSRSHQEFKERNTPQ